jgi:DNA-binding MarR family transcriptional regulator
VTGADPAEQADGPRRAALSELDQVAGVERELRRLLLRLRRYSTELARSVHPDLDPAVYALLVDIADGGPSRAAELADQRGVTKGVISRQVRELERLGLVQRQPDPSDARAQILVVSPDGREAVERAQVLRRKAVHRLLESTTPQDLEAMVQALTRFNDLME